MDFQTAYEAFILCHARQRTGQAAERIRGGLQHAEKTFLECVWWAVFHNFDGLYPEYEVQDFQDGYRYLDFAYIQPHFKIAIEIDGLGPHWKNISGIEFADHWRRQNHLLIDQWKVLRFGYYDVEKRPRGCQQTIQQLLGGLTGNVGGALQTLDAVDREIVRLALGAGRPITVGDVNRHVNLARKASARHLKNLVQRNWLQVERGLSRVHSYRIHDSKTHILL